MATFVKKKWAHFLSPQLMEVFGILEQWGNSKQIFVQLGFSMSNWQKVQLNTGSFYRHAKVFIHKRNGLIKTWLNKLE